MPTEDSHPPASEPIIMIDQESGLGFELELKPGPGSNLMGCPVSQDDDIHDDSDCSICGYYMVDVEKCTHQKHLHTHHANCCNRGIPFPKCLHEGCDNNAHWDNYRQIYSDFCSVACRDNTCGHDITEKMCSCEGCNRKAWFDWRRRKWSQHCGNTCRLGTCDHNTEVFDLKPGEVNIEI